MKLKHRGTIIGLTATIPMVFYVALLLFVPIGMLFYYSFTDYGIAQTTNWVGFQNYIDIFKYPEYLNSFIATILMALILTFSGMILALIIAVLLNHVKTGKGVLRTVWYLPGLISMAIVSQFISIFLAPEGTLNKILVALGGEAVAWTDSTFWMYFWIIALVQWKGLGGLAILLVAALNSISKDIYEAAKIDGANSFRIFINMTLPMLRPMLSYILVTSFIGNMNIFEPVLLISNGGPDGSTKVIMFRLYDEAFRNFRYGFSCALSVVVTIFTLVFSISNIMLSDASIFKFEKGGSMGE